MAAAKPSLEEQIQKLKGSQYGDLLKQQDALQEELKQVQAKITAKDKEFAKEMRKAGFVAADDSTPSSKSGSTGPDDTKRKKNQIEQIEAMAGLLEDKSLSKKALFEACKDAFNAKGINRQGFTMLALDKRLKDPRFVVTKNTVKLAKA